MADNQDEGRPLAESVTRTSGITVTVVCAPTMTGYPTPTTIWRPDLWEQWLR